MSNKKKAIAIIDRKSPSLFGLPVFRIIGKVKSGCECFFVKINKTKGIKLYRNKKECEYACRRQHRAYKHGIGPKCDLDVNGYLFKRTLEFSVYNLRLPCYPGFIFYWGYVTDIALPCKYFNHFQEDELQEKYIKVFGREYDDICKVNCGYYNGNLVIVDFGSLSSTL